MNDIHTFRFVSFSSGIVRAFARLTCVAVALSATACGSAQSGGGGGLFGKKCESPSEAAPELEELVPIKIPKSHLWVVGDVPVKSLAVRVGKEVPIILAQEKRRDVGAPGKATYVVKRGDLSFHQREERLEVRVPIRADISVCKGIGSHCITYGSCHPKFDARFSVGTTVGKNYEWAAPKGHISATEGCVIGLDVTKQIETQAKKEVRKVQDQLAKQWPQLKPQVGDLWRNLARPIPVDEDTCVNVVPKNLSYLPPHLRKTKNGEVLTTALGLETRLLPSKKCTKRKVEKVPKPTKLKKSPQEQSRLWFPELLGRGSVKQVLIEKVSGEWEKGETVEVQDVRFGSTWVALQVKSEGAVCGNFWVKGKLTHKAGKKHISLGAVEPVGSEKTAAMAALIAGIEKRARVPIDSGDWFDAKRIEALKSQLKSQVPSGIDFEIRNLKAQDAKVTVAKNGIYVFHPLTAKLALADI